MAFSPLSRRMFLRHMPGAAAAAGALVSTAVLAAPVAEAVKPVFVKVGSPTISEEPYNRMRRLGKEMADALADIEKHPVAPDSLMAFVFPASKKYPCGTMDLDGYHDMMSRLMTAEQAEAVAAWQLADIEFRSAANAKGFIHGSLGQARFDAMDRMFKAFRA